MIFSSSKAAIRYALYGALFGFLFPLVATVVDLGSRALPIHPTNFYFVQATQPLHWIIDLAPLVLGFMGWRIGVRQDALERVHHELREAMSLQSQELARTNETLRSRAAQLELIVGIVGRMSGILDRRELINSVVEIIGKSLDYYHVHIYLFDEQRQTLIMSGGTGEAGQKMAMQGHRITVGKGIVGTAAQSNLAVVAPTVRQHRNWLPNPLLPETRAEVAVPIRRAERVLGVLDVQHDVAGGLSRGDADVLQTIADQIAVALENAQLYEQVQRKAQQEQHLNSITQKMQSTEDVDEALRITVRELGRAMGGVRTGVRLGNGPAEEAAA